MFVPGLFKMSGIEEMHAFMREHSFAMLVTNSGNGLCATHLPLLLDTDQGVHGTLLGHMAKANSQWRDYAGEVLVIFAGPHTYISPSWYQSPGTVPTWNYLAVHAYGSLELTEDPMNCMIS